MKTYTANEAKTHFGDMLLKAQQAPIQINKNGKPVAVVLSINEHQANEELKLRFLQMRAIQAKSDISNYHTTDGESFLNGLGSGNYD